MSNFLSQKRRVILAKQNLINELSKQSNMIYYDGIANLRAVKAFGKESTEVRHYALKWSTYHEKEYDRDWIQFYKTAILNVIQVSMKVVLIAYCFYSIHHGAMTVGTMLYVFHLLSILDTNTLSTYLPQKVADSISRHAARSPIKDQSWGHRNPSML